MRPLNAQFIFDIDFFADNIVVLERLKSYLRSHPNEYFTTEADYWRLRKYALQWHVPREMENRVDRSLKDLFNALGSVRIYQNTAFYEISPSAVAIAYTHLHYSMNRIAWDQSVHSISGEEGILILSHLFGVNLKCSDLMLQVLFVWIKRETDEVEAALKLLKSETYSLTMLEKYLKMAEYLRYHLCNIVNRPDVFARTLGIIP